MLDDWEERQLADIGRELSADGELHRVLAAPSGRERRRLALERRFYPVGYVLCALAYMTAAVGSDQRPLLIAAYVVAIAFWVVIEVRVAGYQELVLKGLQGLGNT